MPSTNGTKAGLSWCQENPNYLDVLLADGPAQVYKRGNDYLAPIIYLNTPEKGGSRPMGMQSTRSTP